MKVRECARPARAFDLEGRRVFIADGGPGADRSAAWGRGRNEGQGRGLAETRQTLFAIMGLCAGGRPSRSAAA